MYLSIRHKITATLFVSIVFLTLAITLFQQMLAFDQFRAHLTEEAQTTVRLAINKASDWFQSRMTAANLLGLTTEHSLNASQNLETDFVDAVKKLKLESAILALDDGRVVTLDNKTKFKINPFKKSEWYETAKMQRRTFFIGPYLDAKAENYIFSFGTPIFDVNQLYVKGAVCFDAPLTGLQASIGSIFMNRVKNLELVPLAHQQLAIFVRQENISDEDFSALTGELKKGLPKNGSSLWVHRNQYLILYDKIPDTRLLVYYPVSLTQLVRPVLTRTIFLVVVSLLAFFVIFQFASFFIGRFVKRIEDLNERTKTIAAGNFEVKAEKKANDEVGDLAVSFNQMAQHLAAHIETVKESTRHKERINRELELAKELQQNALPATVPTTPGLEIAVISRPAQEVGGDYYDFIYPSKDKIGFVVADAAGKGFSGTIFMTNSRSTFRVIAADEKLPATLLGKMNNFLATNSVGSGLFITILYCVYDVPTKELTYANGGHYAPLLFRPQNKNFLPLALAGLPIGIVPDQIYESGNIKLEAGDILVLYTDGVIEAVNSKKEMFGLTHLKKMIDQNANLTASALTQKIERELRMFSENHSQFDDITLMVIKVK